MSQNREVSNYTNKARLYAQSRPDYANASFQHVISATGLSERSIVADIGAGTGKSSIGFVDHVSKVFAIDSSEEMLNEAIRILGNHPSFEAKLGSAEQVPLPDSSVDLVVVGQALHWFDLGKARREFRRIMKPEALVCIMWNDFGNTPRPPVDGFLEPGFNEQAFDASYTEGWDRFIQGELSSHYSPRPEDPEYESFVETQRSRFSVQAVDGQLTVALMTRAVIGELKLADEV